MTTVLGRRISGPLLGSAMAIALVVGVLPVAHVAAVLGGAVAGSSAAQVRIFGDGEFVASGTLVARNWVLTARHVVQPLAGGPAPSRFTIRFGTTDSSRDDDSNLRAIDRVERHPTADLALLHLAEPVSPYTWIPRLATASPRRNDPVLQYGWGPDGVELRRVQVPVVDPAAATNAAALRSSSENFAVMFPSGVDPLVLDLDADEADSGGGAFATDGRLVGVHSASAPYEFTNGTGGLDEGLAFTASYDQPVWTAAAADWIRRILAGEGSSSPPASPSTGRKLAEHAEQGAGDLPMTQPPQDHVCDPGDEACHQPDPGWLPGTLTGGGNYRGTVLARCAAVGPNGCSFGGTTYPAGAQARFSLGRTSTPSAPGSRKVLVWCGTQTPFPDASGPSRPVLRLSFTNADDADSPVGYGWWDLTADQVTDPASDRPVDPTRLSAC